MCILSIVVSICLTQQNSNVLGQNWQPVVTAKDLGYWSSTFRTDSITIHTNSTISTIFKESLIYSIKDLDPYKFLSIFALATKRYLFHDSIYNCLNWQFRCALVVVNLF